MAYIDCDSLAQFEHDARNGQTDALYNLGLAYSTGQGVGVDYVAAHKWFNLAAMKGVGEARGWRAQVRLASVRGGVGAGTRWGVGGRPADRRPALLTALPLLGGGFFPPSLAGPAFPPDRARPLGEHLLQVSDGPPLSQHVPVTPWRLDLLRVGLVPGGGERDRSADPALPGHGNFRFGGKWHGKVVALRAVKSYLLARGQVRVPVILIARSSEPGAAKCAFGHMALPPRRSAFHVVNTEYPDKIPTVP